MAALPRTRTAASQFSDALSETGAADVRRLDVDVDEPLQQLARRLQDVLARATVAPALAPEERELLAAGVIAAERLVGTYVHPGDVVVLHDTPTAALALALRERGAHAVWRARPGPATSALVDLLTGGMDAYVDARPGQMVAVMPAPGTVVAKQVPAGGALDADGWNALLADVVHGDRAEHVGGTRHARPGVAAR